MRACKQLTLVDNRKCVGVMKLYLHRYTQSNGQLVLEPQLGC